MRDDILSILIVDDDDSDQYLTKRTIRKAGICSTVWSCQDGEEALEFFADAGQSKEKHGDLFPPSVILLDINMPRMGGFEFLAAWERPQSPSPVVVIMLTSSSDEQDRATSQDLGVDLYVEKPLTKEALVKIKQVACHIHAAQDCA